MPNAIFFTRKPIILQEKYSQERLNSDDIFLLLETVHHSIEVNIGSFSRMKITAQEIGDKVIGNFYLDWLKEKLLYLGVHDGFHDHITARAIYVEFDDLTQKNVIDAIEIEEISPYLFSPNIYRPRMTDEILTLDLHFSINVDRTKHVTEEVKKLIQNPNQFLKNVGGTINAEGFHRCNPILP